MAKKKKKSKSASIFPPELALQDPAVAASFSAGYAGLGAGNSINEEVNNIVERLNLEFKALAETLER